jgi:hypothetical protein
MTMMVIKKIHTSKKCQGLWEMAKRGNDMAIDGIFRVATWL